ncbi:helix-turn-helix transcriptional regulator [Caldibacillus thermoamylovorans]|nr:helix-turn-helix transcriptional regulator [Caldibacillus thermoamylovorans]
MNRYLIKRIRQMKGMSQLEFSKALGVSRGLIAQVEAGYISPSPELKNKIREFAGDDFIAQLSKLIY